jgi:MIP family channel proteins
MRPERVSRVPSDVLSTLPDMMMAGDYVRRASAEFVGAFALTFVGASSIMFASSLTDVALAHGLVIGVMVCAVAHISGGHFNPAVTFAFWVTRRISTMLALVYWVTQLAAATTAAVMLNWILPDARSDPAKLGVPQLGQGISAGQGLVVEAVLTFFLVWVIFATVADPNGSFNKVAGLAIGFTITLGVYMGFALTGAAMNPSRAFGPMLVQNFWTHHFWVWYVGPLAGGAIAALLYELLYLRPELEPAPAGTPGSNIDEPGIGRGL